VKTEADFWACRVCRSINGLRADRCYSCHTPREVAAVKPTDLSVTEREPPPGPTGTYVSSEGRAVWVTIAAVAFILATFIALWMNWQVGDLRASADRAAADQLFQERAPFLLVPTVLGILALVAYGAWISRAVANLPPLGAGYSRVSSSWAFLEPLIPGLNLYSLPARAGEVVQKLGGSGKGLPMIAISFFLIIGPPVVAAVLIRVSRMFIDGPEYHRTVATTLIVMFGAQTIGLLLALGVMWHIEGLFRARVAKGMPATVEPASS
jgi:hypothetical protein